MVEISINSGQVTRRSIRCIVWPGANLQIDTYHLSNGHAMLCGGVGVGWPAPSGQRLREEES